MLPKFQSDDQSVNMLQTSWSSAINPLLANPLSSMVILKDVVLATGSNTINHRLNRVLQGWMVIRQNAVANLYDDQDQNPLQNKTLILVTDADVTVNLIVF